MEVNYINQFKKIMKSSSTINLKKIFQLLNS